MRFLVPAIAILTLVAMGAVLGFLVGTLEPVPFQCMVVLSINPPLDGENEYGDQPWFRDFNSIRSILATHDK